MIPQALKSEVIQLAYEEHQVQDKTVHWMRQSVWFLQGQGQGVHGELSFMTGSTAPETN